MTVILPKEQVRAEFEDRVLQAWCSAHGADKGQAHVSWGQDRIVVIIEDALLKGEQLLAQNEQGKAVLERYVYELITQVVEEERETLSRLLQREIVESSASVNVPEQWAMIIFHLAG